MIRKVLIYIENRDFSYDVMQEVENNWSPRAFDSNRQIPPAELLAILEAARHAPSCFNEQPWRYIVAQTEAARQKLVSVLSPANQKWAARAPVLLLIMAKANFTHNQKPNRWHQFDAGASWGYFTLEAQHRGIMTHAMGGFNVDLAREVFSIPEDYSIMAAVAMGYYGDINELSPELQIREHPSPRKPVEEILFL